MGSFLFIIKWLKNRKTINLIFAGVLSGMMLMTRYAGVGFIGGFVISLFFISNSKTYKIRCLLSYITPIVLIFVLWYLYAKSFASSSVDRELIFHPVSLGKIIRSILVMLHWFVKDIFSLVTFMVMILISSYYLKKNYNYFLVYINKFLPFARVLIIVIISYYLFLLVSISFFDYYTKLDTRVLSPVFPMTLILIGIVFNFFIIKINNNFIFSLLTILLAFNIFYSSYDSWFSHYEYGKGYTSLYFKKSVMDVEKLVLENKNLKTFTNGSDLIEFYADLNVANLPVKELSVNLRATKNNYIQEIEEMIRMIENNEAQLIYFDSIRRLYFMPKNEILKKLERFEIQNFYGGFLIKNITPHTIDN